MAPIFKRAAYIVGLIGVFFAAVPEMIDLPKLRILPAFMRLGFSSLPVFNRAVHSTVDLSQYVFPGSLKGKVALVTGGNSGIGLETVKALAMSGAKVIMGARSVSKGREAIEEIKRDCFAEKKKGGKFVDCARMQIQLEELDLADLKNVRNFVSRFGLKLDIVVLNAGKFIKNLDHIEITKDGFEWMFGSHHVGHFYLFQLLLNKSAINSHAHIVATSSALMAVSRGIDFTSLEHPEQTPAIKDVLYGQSKLANVLFAKELHRRYGNDGENDFIVSVNHPGLVRTSIFGEFSWCDQIPGLCFEPEVGAIPNILGAVGPREVVGDRFILPRGTFADWKLDTTIEAQDPHLARKLWEWTTDAIQRRGFSL